MAVVKKAAKARHRYTLMMDYAAEIYIIQVNARNLKKALLRWYIE